MKCRLLAGHLTTELRLSMIKNKNFFGLLGEARKKEPKTITVQSLF